MEVTPITAALGLLSIALSVVVWLGKREINRVFEIAERMPKKEWFDQIQIKIDQFPTLQRLETHFEASHAHANLLTTHTLQLEGLEADMDDHEHRLRVLEGKVKS